MVKHLPWGQVMFWNSAWLRGKPSQWSYRFRMTVKPSPCSLPGSPRMLDKRGVEKGTLWGHLAAWVLSLLDISSCLVNSGHFVIFKHLLLNTGETRISSCITYQISKTPFITRTGDSLSFTCLHLFQGLSCVCGDGEWEREVVYCRKKGEEEIFWPWCQNLGLLSHPLKASWPDHRMVAIWLCYLSSYPSHF